MNKLKKNLKKIIEILSLKELRILPAYLSYNFVLASIPIFTIIVMIADSFSISIDTVISLINDILPEYVSSVIVGAISGKNFDLSIGFLNITMFIIATNGVYAIVEASNSLYKIETSSHIKDRLRAFVILILIIILLLFLIIVPMLGDKILNLLASYKVFENIIDNITLLYKVLKWPLSFLLIFIIIKFIYIIAPSKKVKNEETTIGAFIVTIGWILFTAIFGYYIKYFGKYDLIYGGLSSLSILLIWVYVLSFILVLGMVINTIKYNKPKKEE
ncbi:MAG: YihY/virulence factor BrkB family protein [Bacilli bacterium]